MPTLSVMGGRRAQPKLFTVLLSAPPRTNLSLRKPEERSQQQHVKAETSLKHRGGAEGRAEPCPV